MYDLRGLITSITESGDISRMDKLCELIDKLISQAPDCEALREDLYILQNGPHFTMEVLENSGVPLKYTPSEITRYMDSHGMGFGPKYRIEDICYTVNSLYSLYYPLLPDLGQTLKFTEKYLHDESWPGDSSEKPYMIWRKTIKK